MAYASTDEAPKSKWRARKTGRDRKAGQRERETGNLRRPPPSERAADIKKTVLNQPHRRGIPMSTKGTDGPQGPSDPRAAYVFGRMRLRGDLTTIQHNALQHWLETFVRYSRAVGLPQIHYGSCLAQNVGGGDHGEEPDPKAATALANRSKRAFAELEEGMADSLGFEVTECNVALVHVCLMDREPTGNMEGSLRQAANAIDRHRCGGGKRKALDASLHTV